MQYMFIHVLTCDIENDPRYFLSEIFAGPSACFREKHALLLPHEACAECEGGTGGVCQTGVRAIARGIGRELCEGLIRALAAAGGKFHEIFRYDAARRCMLCFAVLTLFWFTLACLIRFMVAVCEDCRGER